MRKTRCSGFYCENSFSKRESRFSRYPADAPIRFIAMDCGGCPGNLVLPHLRHLAKCLKRNTDIAPGQAVVHLSSCMALSNYHGPKCPYLNRIKLLVERAGFSCVEGTKISEKAEERRQQGLYD